VGAVTVGAIAAGCSDPDKTEICIGPTCPQYDGVGGDGNYFHNGPDNEAGSAGENTGGSAGEGTAGSAGENTGGSAGEGSAGSAGASGSSGDPPDSGPTPDACQLAFVAPVPGGDAGALRLDGSSDTDAEACGSEFAIAVGLTSNAKSVTLFVNDAPLAAQDVVDGTVNFNAVLGNRGATANVLRAEATMADNSTCSLQFASNILVDCPGPSCSIAAPVANDDGYLNATQDNDDVAGGLQTDIVVSTELENQGQHVRLQIDGTFDTFPAVDVVDDNGSGSATFGGVTLAEGPRTIRAECRDSFGVTTLSAPAAFNVDTNPCTVSLGSIAGGANPITPGSDNDPIAAGIQVTATGQVTGGDCKTLWIGVCDGALTPLPLTGLDEDGHFSLPVSLTGSGSLNVCAQAEDFAGNLGAEAQEAVNLRLQAPQVAISSPAGSTRYNRLGTGGAVADGDDLTTACEAAVVVACSEDQQNVDLLADGQLIAQATCSQGQASFLAASLPSKNDGSSTVLTARQTITGFDPVVSAGVSVQADCEVPTCNLSSPDTGPDFLNASNDSLPGTAGFQISFGVISDPDSVNATLIIDDEGNNPLTTALAPQGGGTGATIADVTLAEGPHSARFQCADAAGNVQTSTTEQWTVDTVPCSSSLLVAGGASPITPTNDQDPSGEPGLQVTVSGQTTGGDCTSARVGSCNALSGSFSTLAGNQSFSLGATLPSTTGPTDVCVEVSDAAGNIASVPITVAVRVDVPVVAITSPANNSLFNVASTCVTDIEVACSDVGSDVLLLIDNVLSPVTATCQLGNTAIFSGFALPTKNDGSSTTVTVQQTADGLTSLPASISVTSDCEAPEPLITAPTCGGPVLAVPESDLDLGVTPGMNVDVDVDNDGIPLVDLTVTRGASSSSSQVDGGVGATTTTFSALDLGGPGNISLQACVTDAAGNPGCSDPCALTIADHPDLAITSPAAAPAFLNAATTDCASGVAGLDVTVAGTSSAADGSAVQIQIGSGAVASTTVLSGAFSTCVAAPEGLDQTLSVSVTDSGSALVTSTSMQVNVDSLAPAAVLASALTVNVTGRRQGTLNVSWNKLVDTDGGDLTAYQMRCANSDIVDEAAWSTATPIALTALPSDPGPNTQAFTGFHTGKSEFCALRGVDKAGNLTAIAAGQSAIVANPFLTQQYTSIPAAFNAAQTINLFSMAPLGDINGDGTPLAIPPVFKNDFIVGYANRGAQVFFGGSALNTATQVTISPQTTGSGGRLGQVVAGLGDINGDGRPDFAVSAPFLNTTTGGTSAGGVFVFFGKDTWPSTITMAAAPGCTADICFHGAVAGAQLGTAVTSADFDGDGALDIVMGAPLQSTGGRVYVVLGGSHLSSVATGTVFNMSSTPTVGVDGFVVDPPTTTANQFFGITLASVSPVQVPPPASPGALVIGAVGGGGVVESSVYFLAGQAYPPATTGLVPVSPGAPFVTTSDGGKGDFGAPIASLGDFNGDGRNDVCVSGGALQPTLNFCNVYLGKAGGGFGTDSLLTFTNDLGTQADSADNDWGHFAADSFHSAFGLLGDLDKDNKSELALGSVFVSSPLRPGTVELFYGGTGVTSNTRSNADAHLKTASSGALGVNFVGDIDGDTFNDVLLFDTNATGSNPATPRVTLLY
jgi:hypothetical protein